MFAVIETQEHVDPVRNLCLLWVTVNVLWMERPLYRRYLPIVFNSILVVSSVYKDKI